MKTSTTLLLGSLCLLLGACATHITEGPTRPVSHVQAAPTPRPSVAAPASSPTPTPVTRPTPYPIPQKPDTGVSPLAPQADQPIWQRTN